MCSPLRRASCANTASATCLRPSRFSPRIILKARASLGVSLSRGLIAGGAMLYLLPPLFGADSHWFATPVAEISVAAVTVLLMRKFTRELA